jgi:hypothetical protein
VTNRLLIAPIVGLSLALAGAGCASSKSTTSSSSSAGSSSASFSSAGSSSASSSSATTSSSASAAPSSPAAFKAAFLADRTQLRQLGANLRRTIIHAGAKTDAQLATQLSSLGDRAKAQAAKLSHLNPPAKFKPTVDTLVSALKSVGDRLQKIATDASNDNAAAAKADTIKLVNQSAAVKAADDQLSSSLGLS